MSTPIAELGSTLTKPDSRALFFAYATVFLFTMGVGLVTPVIPEIIAPLIKNPKWLAPVAGLLQSTYALCQFLAAPGLGALSDRVGRRPILLICILGSSLGYLLFGIGGALTMLFLGRIIDGITGGNISTIFAYVADITQPEQRGLYMGRLGAAAGLGFVFGPVLGGFTANFGYSAPFFAAVVLTLSNVVWGFFFMPESRPQKRHAAAIALAQLNPFTQLWRVFSIQGLGWLLVVTFLYISSFSMLQSNIAVVSKDVHSWNPQTISWIFLLIGIESILVQGVLLKWLLPKFGDVTLAISGLSLLSLGLAIIALSVIVHVSGLLLAGIAAFGLGDAFATPTVNSLISRAAGPDNQGQVQGGNQSIAALGRVIGPLLGGQMYTFLGAMSPYLLGALAFAGAVRIVHQQVRRLESVRGTVTLDVH